MNKTEHKNVEDSVRKLVEQAKTDLFGMGKGKGLKKALHKSRMQDFQNNAFNKKAKK